MKCEGKKEQPPAGKAASSRADPGQIDLTVLPSGPSTDELLVSLGEQSFAGMFIYQDDRTVYANRPAAEILGYSVDELCDPGLGGLAAFIHPDDLPLVMEQAGKKQAGEEDVVPRYTYRVLTKSRQTRWVELFSQTFLYKGRPAIFGIVVDITPSKRAEGALRESEERFRVMFDNSHDLMTISDLEAKTLWANKAWCETLGYTPQTQGDPFDKVHPDDLERTAAAWESFVKTGELTNFEYRYRTARGDYVTLETTARMLTAAGKPFVSVIAHDVTKRKRAESDLRESERRYRLLAENVKDVIWTVDMNLKLTYLSPSIRKLTGWSAEEQKKLTLEEMFTPQSLRLIRETFEEELAIERRPRKRLKRGRTIELEHRTKAGRTVWAEARVTFLRGPDSTPVGVIGVSRDISQRKRAELALRESEARFRELAESLPTTVCEVNERGEILFVNQAGFDAFGYTRADFRKGLNVLQMLVSRDHARAQENMRRVLRGERLGGVEYTAKRKDGTTFPVIIRSDPLVRGDKIAGFLAIVVDITERKLAEEALRQSEEKYRTLFESAPEAVFLFEMDGTVIDCNEAAAKLIGVPAEKIIGHHVGDFAGFDGESAERALGVFAGAGRGEEVAAAELRLTPHGRESRWIEVYPTLVNIGADTRAIQVIACDITEQRRMQEELLRAQKLESIGILAGGIAHDFNNLLGAVLANVSLAQKYSESKTTVSERLRDARDALARAQNLAQRLLTFSKGGTPIKRTISLHGIVAESVTLAAKDSNVQCQVSIPDDLWPVEADESQIYQVINNILTNAVQATPDGGMVTVRAENLPASMGGSLPVSQCDCIRLSIEDHGAGIPQEHIPKIFDPYFTTKRQGLGLGLATAHAIVSRHRGHISVDSEPNAGTTFHIYLPAAKERTSETPVATGIPAQADVRVLVVDDDELMLQAAAAVLRDLGHDAALAHDGDEAVELYRRALDSGNPFDVVIMDLTIPQGLGGKEAMVRLSEIDPGVKAIATSGYTDDPVLAAFEDFGFQGILRKPYAVEDMGSVISRVLGAGRE